MYYYNLWWIRFEFILLEKRVNFNFIFVEDDFCFNISLFICVYFIIKYEWMINEKL